MHEYFKSINTYWDKTWYVQGKFKDCITFGTCHKKVLETEIWKVKSHKFNNDVIQKMPQASGIHESLQNNSDNNTLSSEAKESPGLSGQVNFNKEWGEGHSLKNGESLHSWTGMRWEWDFLHWESSHDQELLDRGITEPRSPLILV